MSLSLLYFPGGKMCEALSAVLPGNGHLKESATCQVAQ